MVRVLNRFPDPRFEFPVLVEEFPVPSCRELPRDLQGFCHLSMAKTAHTTPSQRYFPVFSLHIREIERRWACALDLCDEAKVVARQIDLFGLRGA